MFEMVKTILLDALGIKAAPTGVGARGVMPAMDFDPDFGAATLPAVDRAGRVIGDVDFGAATLPAVDRTGHVIGDRDYLGVIGDHD